MPTISVGTTAPGGSWPGKGNRLSITITNEDTTNPIFYLLERGEGRTISATVNDGKITAGNNVSFNLMQDGPDMQGTFVFLATGGAVTTGILETFGVLPSNVNPLNSPRGGNY